MTYSERGAWIVDLAPGNRGSARALPSPSDSHVFLPGSWSPDGRSLSGVVFRLDGQNPDGLWVYSLESGRYQRLTDFGNQSAWLRDGRRLLFRRLRPEGGIFLFDTRSKESRQVLAVPRIGVRASLRLSRDNRLISFVETATEGDVWLMTFR